MVKEWHLGACRWEGKEVAGYFLEEKVGPWFSAFSQCLNIFIVFSTQSPIWAMSVEARAGMASFANASGITLILDNGYMA